MQLESRVVYSCAFYLLAFVLVVVSKPSAVFDERGGLRGFGVTKHDANGSSKDAPTVAPLGVVTAVIAITSFYRFCVVDLVL